MFLMWVFACQEELSTEKKKLTEYFESGPGSQSPPTSLYFQAMGRRYPYNATFLLKIQHKNNNYTQASPNFYGQMFNIPTVCTFYSRLYYIRVAIFAENLEALLHDSVKGCRIIRVPNFRRNAVSRV